jgi:hypothetical protein
VIVSRAAHPWTASLVEQLPFSASARPQRWDEAPELAEPPLAIVFIPDREGSNYPPMPSPPSNG